MPLDVTAQVRSRAEMTHWEAEIQSAGANLSEMENKKLHLMKNRLWKRATFGK